LQATHCGAKHAIKGFTDALRCELRHDRSGVRVTMVHERSVQYVLANLREATGAAPAGVALAGAGALVLG